MHCCMDHMAPITWTVWRKVIKEQPTSCPDPSVSETLGFSVTSIFYCEKVWQQHNIINLYFFFWPSLFPAGRLLRAVALGRQEVCNPRCFYLLFVCFVPFISKVIYNWWKPWIMVIQTSIWWLCFLYNLKKSQVRLFSQSYILNIQGSRQFLF